MLCGFTILFAFIATYVWHFYLVHFVWNAANQQTDQTIVFQFVESQQKNRTHWMDRGKMKIIDSSIANFYFCFDFTYGMREQWIVRKSFLRHVGIFFSRTHSSQLLISGLQPPKSSQLCWFQRTKTYFPSKRTFIFNTALKLYAVSSVQQARSEYITTFLLYADSID